MPNRVNHNTLDQNRPLLHTLAAWSNGAGDSYLYGYFCDPSGLPIRSATTGLPMVTKAMILDGSATEPVGLNALIVAIDAECSTQIDLGPWPTGFVVQRVEGAAAHIHIGAVEQNAYDFIEVGHMSADVSSYVIPVGDYSAAPIVIGYGKAMDLEGIKRVEILTPVGSAPVRIEVANPGVGIGFNLTATQTIVSAPGKLLGFAVVNPASGSSITLYDGTSGSDPVLFGPISGVAILPWIPVNRAFATGLHAIVTGGTPTFIGARGPI